MLLQGLRSQEVLDLNREDLLLPEAQIRVRGKGNKTALPAAGSRKPSNCSITICGWSGPIPPPAASVRLSQRSRSRSPHDTRGTALPVPLSSPDHRRVKLANPHRFRHTFASDMVRAGVSLPALMQLMGHAHIQTTLVYVQITPLEVYQQYARAVAQHIRPVPVTPS